MHPTRFTFYVFHQSPNLPNTHTLTHTSHTHTHTDDNEYDYYPEDCVFKSVAAIPQALLLNVIELYSRSKDYCKWCYYKDNEKVCF